MPFPFTLASYKTNLVILSSTIYTIAILYNFTRPIPQRWAAGTLFALMGSTLHMMQLQKEHEKLRAECEDMLTEMSAVVEELQKHGLI